MKTRQGFVSNSSTSSFILCAPAEDVYKSLELVHPVIRKKMKEWFVDTAEIIEYEGRQWLRGDGSLNSEETYGIMAEDEQDEPLAFEEIEKFFERLGKLSHFDGY